MSQQLRSVKAGPPKFRMQDACLAPSDKDLQVKAAPSYFRTHEQVNAAMRALAAKYPDLAQVVKIGESYEKREILALKLTSGKNPAESPRVLHFGGEHAREIANPEILMKWSEWLTGEYGSDATATGLLDTRELWIVPIMNPDGHVVVEKGFTRESGGDTMHRKNTVPPRGTDNNRNYPHSKWGSAGASGSPSSQTYRGKSAGSDPETQAIVQLCETIKPTLLIDWHSYSELNLYPWGWTREPTQDAAAFKKIAEKFTEFNDYTPQPSIDLYATSGTSIDWAYEKLNVAALCIETGTSFHQSDREFEETWQKNFPVLNYSSQIADAPFERAFGPGVEIVEVSAEDWQVEAYVSGEAPIAAVEMSFGEEVPPGMGLPLKAQDGTFDADTELASAVMPRGASRFNIVYVRAQDVNGHWGPATAAWVDGPPCRAADVGAQASQAEPTEPTETPSAHV